MEYDSDYDYDDYFVDDMTLSDYQDYDDDLFNFSLSLSSKENSNNDYDEMTKGDYENYDDDTAVFSLSSQQDDEITKGDYEDYHLSDDEDTEDTEDTENNNPILQQPQSQSASIGESVIFDIKLNNKVVDTTILKYQWFKNTCNKENMPKSPIPFFMMTKALFKKDEIIIGANSSSYKVDNITKDDDGDYFVIVKDINNTFSVISNPAILTVIV